MRRLLLALGLILPLAACEAQTPSAALTALEQGSHLVIDVRSSEEFAAGHLPGARLIPHFRIGTEIASVAPNKDTPILLYCRSGRRSQIARQALLDLGYSQVIDAGGFEQLKGELAAAGKPSCEPASRC